MNLKWTKERLASVRRLYSSGLSMREVAARLGISMSTIYHAMQRHGVSRRKASETNTIRFLKSPVSFVVKTRLSFRERLLKTAGLMLYWAEGGKRGVHVVDFANSDSGMIALFLRFLREIYQVREERLRVYLYCYSDQNPGGLVNYWSNLTKIPTSQFSKPYVKIAPNSRVHGKMEHGLVHIRYADMRLLSMIMEGISRLTETL